MGNVGLYWLFVFSTLAIARGSQKIIFQNKYADKIFGVFRFNRADTVAMCYVIPAKTPALGVPLINAMYLSNSAVDAKTKSILQIPLILYQIEQLVFSQSTIPLFRRWIVKDQKKQQMMDNPGLDDSSVVINLEQGDEGNRTEVNHTGEGDIVNIDRSSAISREEEIRSAKE